jgi:histidyl-tRNA synthetase
VNNQKLQPIRGAKDLYGFNEISTPVFEFSKIYERNLGETSDIIAKEVYKFPDRGDNFLTLRPEFTAGVIRAFISNGDLGQNLPQKLFSSGAVFRYDRPQKGRQRQFHQINFENIEQSHYLKDVEMILLATKILDDLEILPKTTLQINSLGYEQTKANYQNALQDTSKKTRSSTPIQHYNLNTNHQLHQSK